jgi:hypothetical protein
MARAFLPVGLSTHNWKLCRDPPRLGGRTLLSSIGNNEREAGSDQPQEFIITTSIDESQTAKTCAATATTYCPTTNQSAFGQDSSPHGSLIEKPAGRSKS